MACQEDEPKYKVFDALNRVRPPPNILDLQGRRLDTKIQIDEALSNVPNYGLRKEEVEDLEAQMCSLETMMREYRLRKKEIYETCHKRCIFLLKQHRVTFILDTSTMILNLNRKI